LVDGLKITKSSSVQFFQRGCLVAALALIWLCGSQPEKALAMQSPKIGEATCPLGNEIDPYSFWPRIRQQDIPKLLSQKYFELKNIEQLAEWITCRGFQAKIYNSLDSRYSYFVNAHFSRLRSTKKINSPLWGFDIPIFGGAWGYNIEIYFDKEDKIENSAIKNLWN
jgi:hypothetical protein